MTHNPSLDKPAPPAGFSRYILLDIEDGEVRGTHDALIDAIYSLETYASPPLDRKAVYKLVAWREEIRKTHIVE